MCDDKQTCGEGPTDNDREEGPGKAISDLMTGLQDMKCRQEFLRLRKHLAKAVSIFGETDMHVAYAYYVAGRMAGICWVQDQLEMHSEAADNLMTRAVVRVSDAVGQTTEELQANLEKVAAEEPDKESEHAAAAT